MAIVPLRRRVGRQRERHDRQGLLGGHYALIDGALEPRPDYWALVLWKRLMGAVVLNATAVLAGGGGGDLGERLHVCAHCAIGGGGGGHVAVAFVNADAATAFALRLSLLTAPNPQSAFVELNGARLARRRRPCLRSRPSPSIAASLKVRRGRSGSSSSAMLVRQRALRGRCRLAKEFLEEDSPKRALTKPGKFHGC